MGHIIVEKKSTIGKGYCLMKIPLKVLKMTHRFSHLISQLILVLFVATISQAGIPESPRSIKAIEIVKDTLTQELSEKGLDYGSPIFIRIFKRSEVLEVWVQSDNYKYKLFKKYNICYFSGDLGPKTKEGDNQSPEGFYFVTANNLNPWSEYHLSFNLGYPNSYDRYYKRTGSALMVHGKCVSIGCFAMTDSRINEIYALAHAALQQGQPFFRVHIFPFEMTKRNMSKFTRNEWYPFWVNLKEGYDLFEENNFLPNTEVLDGEYIFN